MTQADAAVFEPVAPNPDCAYCSGRKPMPAFDIDAAYCLTLAESPEREASVVAHFHDIGLCRRVVLRRANRLKERVNAAIWESHRDAARHALARGCQRVLIMEDDVAFNQPVAEFSPRVSRTFKALPDDWWGLYLGHVPVQAYPVGRGVVRARSGALHAYIAHTPMLEWYARYRPRAAEIPLWSLLSPAIDAATSLLPKMYALFPMVAFQRDTGDRRIDSSHTMAGTRRSLFDFDRYRYLVLFNGMRVAEILAVLGSPFHWLTMDWFIARAGRRAREAQRIRDSGLFDEAFYLASYPDVGASGVDPLLHYIKSGEADGRRPNPAFDPNDYASAHGLRPGESALLHYVTAGHFGGDPAAHLDGTIGEQKAR
ncbi:MAG: hypothetical protein AB7V13_03650 [Pseudorhodoplanes sp.]|uniref:hypothetical protein n=1 Tax=Pseudorhodoplanes sp. TaxID=1934341 RepID=UPI003D1354A1